jgi:hypothetical protein
LQHELVVDDVSELMLRLIEVLVADEFKEMFWSVILNEVLSWHAFKHFGVHVLVVQIEQT